MDEYIDDQLMVRSWLVSYIKHFKQPDWTRFTGFYYMRNKVKHAEELVQAQKDGLIISMAYAVRYVAT